jgi:hypothetical protein
MRVSLGGTVIRATCKHAAFDLVALDALEQRLEISFAKAFIAFGAG